MPRRLTDRERAERERERAAARKAETERRRKEAAQRRANLKADKGEVRAILKGATADQMRRFLEKEMARDATVLDRFSHDTGITRARRTDYRPRIAAIFSRADSQVEGRGWADKADFGGVAKAAKGFEKAGDMDEAARIYIQLCEAISSDIKTSFDSGGHYEAWYARSVRMLGECARKMDDEKARRAILSKMVGICVENDPENYDEEYDDALLGALATPEDAEHVVGEVGKRLPRPSAGKGGARSASYYRSITIINLYGKALAAAGGGERLAKFAARYGNQTAMVRDINARLKDAKSMKRAMDGIMAKMLAGRRRRP